MDDLCSTKREMHRMLQLVGYGAIDLTAIEAHQLLESVRDKRESLQKVFVELERKLLGVVGQYEADFSPPKLGKRWRETVHANRFRGYSNPRVELLRHEVYSEDGTPDEMRAYIRTTEPAFPLLVTVRALGRVQRDVGSHYFIFRFAGQPEKVHVTASALPFKTYAELESCLQEIVKCASAIDNFVLVHRIENAIEPEDPNIRHQLSELQSQLMCPVCWSTTRDTVLDCGHTYCIACVGRLLESGHTCASCRQPITGRRHMFL